MARLAWFDAHQLSLAKEGRLLSGRVYRHAQAHYPHILADARRVYTFYRDEVRRLEDQLTQQFQGKDEQA